MAAAVVLLLAPVPASAGGPTSVLLVSPNRQVAAALYNDDTAYTRLHQLLGESPVADPTAPPLHGGPGTEAINVTWLMHDVWVWRVDRVFVNAVGGPWIETHIRNRADYDMRDEGLPDLGKPGVLHRASSPGDLRALLGTMRLTGEDAVSNQGIQGRAEEPQPAVSTPVATAAGEREPADLNWLWLLIGAGAGAVLAIGFRPLVRRIRPS